MTRGLTSALLCTAVLLGAAPAARAATLSVAPDGSDEGDCSAAACATFKYAYEQSAAGDVVEVRAGVFGRQLLPEGTKAVTFSGQPGNKVRQLHNAASNVTFDGLDVDAGGTRPDGAAFENLSAPGVTFKNGRIGNVVDEKGALLGGWASTAPLDLVMDNVEFHDVVQQTNGVHSECAFSETPGLTIRNSRFTNCATMDLLLVRGDWWGQPAYGGITLENNVFEHSVNGTGWHSYSVYFSIGKFENVRVVNNTFETAVATGDVGIGPYSGVWANNIGGGWDCLSGVTFRSNVGEKCHTSDKQLQPAFSCAPPACTSARTMPAGWVDPAAGDFHLIAASPARGAGDASYAPPLDRDGTARGPRPDAGAYQRPGDVEGPVCAPQDLGEVPKATPVVTNVLCAGRDLSYTVLTAPQHGEASVNPSGAATYKSSEGYQGPDRFTVKAFDPRGNSATTEITVMVANHAPVCTQIDLKTVPRGNTASDVMDCTDADGDPLTYSIVMQPKGGTVSIPPNGRTLFYTAALGFSGRDDFTYVASDGTASSEPTPVTVVVGNSAPSCPGGSDTIRAGKAWPVILECGDEDGDPLTYPIFTQPEHGTAEVISDDFGASLVYTPSANFKDGIDTVRVRAYDGLSYSDPADFTFHVTANHAPVCVDRLRHTRVGTPVTVIVTCADQDRQDADQLAFAVASEPAHGTLSQSDALLAGEASFTYTPAPGYTGLDAFGVKASDGDLSGTATTRIHVADMPFCDDLPPLKLAQHANATVDLTCTQPDGAAGPLTYNVVTQPTKGTVSLDGSSLHYTAGDNGGPDSFTVAAHGDSGEYRVTQSIDIAYGPPTCAGQDLSVPGDETLDVTLSCTDPAPGDPQLEIVTAPPASEGTLGPIDQVTNRVRFTPALGFAGDTSFTFRARRADVLSDPVTVKITVTAPNHAPTASIADPGNAYRNTPVNLTATYGDPDGDDTIDSTAWDLDNDGSFDNGTSPTTSVTFTTLGPKTVRFRVTDGGGKATIAERTIDVVNRAPTASIEGPATADRNQAVTFTAHLADPDGPAGLTRAWDTDGDGFDDGGGETVSVAFAKSGVQTVRLRVTDGDGGSVVASWDVTVGNRAPTASIGDVAGPVYRNTPVHLSATYGDPDGDDTIKSAAWDLNGDGKFDDGEGATATVAFTTLGAKVVRFLVTDDDGKATTVEKTIDVVNRAPTASIEGPAKAFKGEAVSLTGAAGDPDGDATIKTREWDIDGDGFDDGSGTTLTVAFPTTGEKTVRFQVTDDDGSATIAGKTIDVVERPVDTGGGTQPTQPLAGSPPAVTPPAVDLIAPRLTIAAALQKQKLGTVTTTGVKLAFTASEACTVAVTATVDKATARKLHLGNRATTVGKLTQLVQAGQTELTLKFTVKARNAIRRAKRAVKLKIALTATDAARNSGANSTVVTLSK